MLGFHGKIFVSNVYDFLCISIVHFGSYSNVFSIIIFNSLWLLRLINGWAVNQDWNTEILTWYQSEGNLKRKLVFWHKGFCKKINREFFVCRQRNLFFYVQDLYIMDFVQSTKFPIFFSRQKKITQKIFHVSVCTAIRNPYRTAPVPSKINFFACKQKTVRWFSSVSCKNPCAKTLIFSLEILCFDTMSK